MLHAMRNVDAKEMAVATDDSRVDMILARIDGCNCFHDLLFYHHQERPDRVAVQDGSSSVTYAEALGRAERLAARLVAEGLATGDRIALLAKNDVAFVDLMMAAS